MVLNFERVNGPTAGQTARDGTSLRVLTTGLYRRRKGIENIVHAAAALRAAGLSAALTGGIA